MLILLNFIKRNDKLFLFNGIFTKKGKKENNGDFYKQRRNI